MQNNYELIDSGSGRKLERFGRYVLSRPCAQAVWAPRLPRNVWESADALFVRDGDNKWEVRNSTFPQQWQIETGGIAFKIAPTDFGHLGIFPEQRPFWEWMQAIIPKRTRPSILNLFAYSGGSTLAAAKAGAEVCHLDASKGMVAWARENAALNHLKEAPIRWIVDDVFKFLAREIRRGRRYDGVIFDPPSFGRGSKGEVFKIEEEILPLLQQCRTLLSDTPLFVLFSCHTPGFTPIAMHHLLTGMMQGIPGQIDTGEMLLSGTREVLTIPSGTYARWTYAKDS